MSERTVLVVASGAAVADVAAAPTAHYVIAADGGIHPLLAASRPVDLVVGDADSAAAAELEQAVAAGAEVHHHPVDKDESDLELALAAALAAGATHVHAVLDDGGRLDHQLANLAVLASPRWAATIDARIGPHTVWVVRGRRELPLSVGDHVALQPIGGPATGVRTGGLRHELAGEELDPFAARGIANEVVALPVVVDLEAGVVLAISSPTPSTGRGDARSRGEGRSRQRASRWSGPR